MFAGGDNASFDNTDQYMKAYLVMPPRAKAKGRTEPFDAPYTQIEHNLSTGTPRTQDSSAAGIFDSNSVYVKLLETLCSS